MTTVSYNWSVLLSESPAQLKKWSGGLVSGLGGMLGSRDPLSRGTLNSTLFVIDVWIRNPRRLAAVNRRFAAIRARRSEHNFYDEAISASQQTR